MKASEDDLRKLFDKFGEISRIKMLKRQNMHKAFIDMDNEKAALSAIEELDGYDFMGLRLEVRFTDADTAKQYPASKFKKRDKFRKGDDYRGDKRDRDYRDDRPSRGGRGGGRDDGMKRSNTYGYDRRDYDRGGRKYDNDDYYDYEDDDYDYEDDRRQGGGNSYRRHGEKDGYNQNKRRDDRNDYRGKSRDYKGGDSWRGGGKDYDRGYNKYDNKKPYDKGTQESSQAENEERVLYVNNLNYDTTEAGLEKAFEKFGTVERVAIGYRRDGRSLGNAQIQFKSKREAVEAIEKMDGAEVDGRPIKAKIFKSYENYKKEKEAQSPGFKDNRADEND